MSASIKRLNMNGGAELQLPAYSDALILVANTAKSYTVPANITSICFVRGQIGTYALWANFTGATAVIPAGDVVGGVNSMALIDGVHYQVVPGQVISIICGQNNVVSLQGYGLTLI